MLSFKSTLSNPRHFVPLTLVAFLFFISYILVSPTEPSIPSLRSPSLKPAIELESQASFRDKLTHVRPSDAAPHSRTLGLNKIFVINLPSRRDRRERMELLASALGADFTYRNGTLSAAPDVLAVIERVRLQREKDGIVAVTTPGGGLAPGEKPPQDEESYPFTPEALALLGPPFSKPLGLEGSDLWTLPVSHPLALDALPPAPIPDTRPPIHLIMTDLKETHRWLDDDALGFEAVSGAIVACWMAHYNVLREIAEDESLGEDGMALILEDDVDIEFDFEQTLRRVLPGLPKGWDVLLPGYCDSTETTHRPVPGYPRLRPSDHPLCNHGYIINRRGALRLSRLLRSPYFAYGRPLDQAYKFLLQTKKLSFYSIAPVVVVQEHKTVSDLRVGKGDGWWDDFLTDPTLERVQLLLEQEDKDIP